MLRDCGPFLFPMFVARGCVAGIAVLELFNHIAHYALVRAPLGTGRHAAPDGRHSWNSSNVLANALIFNQGRRSARYSAPAAGRLTAQPAGPASG